MRKMKRYLTALVSGVFLATAVLSGCGQSKKEVSKNDDPLTVYLWENRLMKNIVPYIHEQFPDQPFLDHSVVVKQLSSISLQNGQKPISLYTSDAVSVEMR